MATKRVELDGAGMAAGWYAMVSADGYAIHGPNGETGDSCACDGEQDAIECLIEAGYLKAKPKVADELNLYLMHVAIRGDVARTAGVMVVVAADWDEAKKLFEAKLAAEGDDTRFTTSDMPPDSLTEDSVDFENDGATITVSGTPHVLRYWLF